jgi:iron complex outermembrane receptor protein
MKKYFFLLLCGTALAIDAGVTYADSELEEITVTARKRDESLQNVPVQVTAITAEALKMNLATDLSTLAELAPQVSVGSGGAGTEAVITIRGISSATSDAGLDQSILLDVDGVPLSRGTIVFTSLFDVKGVQILEGPQALYFGKNSPGGVISIRTEDPTSNFEGYARAGYEFEANERYLEAAVSGPITDTLKVRFAVRGSEMDGWLRNVAQPVADPLVPGVMDPGANWGLSAPQQNVYAGRVTLLWTPTDNFEARAKVEVSENQQNAGGATSEPFCIAPTTHPVILGAIPIPNGDCAKNMVIDISGIAPEFAKNFPFGNGGVPYSESQYTLGSLNLNQKFDKLTLTSITGTFDQKFKNLYNSDWSPFATIWAASDEAYRLFTEEVRGNTSFDGPLNVSAGVYYENFTRPFFNSPDLFHAYNPVAQNYAAVEMSSHAGGHYISPFFEVRWNIIPSLELAAGARYSHDVKNISITNVAAAPSYVPILYPVGVSLNSNYSNNNTSPEVTLSWHPDQDQTLYVAYKTGYKGGGMSNPFLLPPTATASNILFKPETDAGAEIGYKATLLNRTLRFDVGAYTYKYKDLQVVSYDVATISFTLQNAASSRVQGLEGSAEWLATNALSFKGNFGFNSAKYLSFPTAQCYSGQTAAQGCVNAEQNLAGQRLLRAPALTFTVGADYKVQVAPNWGATFEVSGNHVGSYQAATDYAPGGYQSAFWLVNASVRTGPDNGHYEVAVIGRDLTNSYYMLQEFGWSGSLNNNQYVGYFNRPREIVLQATARF